MKKFEELKSDEKNEIMELVSNWLYRYKDIVVKKVISQKGEEIVNNENTIYLLRELKKREDREKIDFKNDIENLFRDLLSFYEYDTHSDCLTHSKSYLDVLYDIYIKDL